MRELEHMWRALPDVPLANENTGVVDGLGETELVDASLEATLQEVLDLESQDVIELHAGLVEDTDADETTNESVTLEETLGVLLVEREQRTVLISIEALPAHWSRKINTYRAARRILDRVSWTRQTSRLLRRPYSPTSLSSVSLGNY